MSAAASSAAPSRSSAAPSGSAASGAPSSAASSGSVSASSSNTIPQSAPAGSLTITSPPQTSVAFFKVASNQPITFAWSFTDLLSIPASLTVSAVCANGVTYPVGPTNGVIPGNSTSVVWDAYAFQQANPQSPLPQSTYTLNIFDERGPGAARSPGLLSPNANLRFALYTPQPYTPIASGWQCSGCNVAAADRLMPTHPAFVSVIATILVMFISGVTLLRQGAR
ncbi:hypothetical protein K488DRAFT_39467 [Vararia minispora EC-137]|uniref:Uncharacterized protein n=1 Tax=Vararia minispora EC-137 TaxID=1314806 RepID=A0ACB8R0Z9_9AGAM|nr:hypothetical protein K488DRAFT_39467 [Vararia minispora EC-137]